MNKLQHLFLALLMSTGFLAFAQSDDCSTAVQITPTFTTCSFQAATSANATQSMPSCSGGGIADDDVWFYFVANSSSTTITVDPTTNYDAVIELFSGTCGALTSIQCQDVNGINGDEVLTNTTLTVGNTYYVRVYHYGVGSGSNTFNICISGLAPPTNNTPCNAFALPTVTPNCNFLTYTNLGSAGSTVGTPSGCGGSSPFQGGYAGGDVWFSVVVPASGQLDIHTLSMDFTDGAMALYSGPCTAPVQIACDDDSGPGLMPYIYATGLTPGSTVYIRVWEYGNNNNGQFGICVSTPDNDNCNNAQQICDLNGYGGVTSSAYTIDQPCNMCGIGDPLAPNPGCVFGTGYTGSSPVQIDNNSWLSFTADSTTAVLFVQVNVCANGNGMQMQIFEGNGCCNFTPVSNFLETTTSQSITATGLTPGNTYYIVVDGFAGDVCSYTISATSGVDVVTAVPANDNICIGQSTTLTAQVNGSGPFTYSWTSQPNDPSLTTPNAPSVTVTPTQNTLYTVTITGKCGTPSVANAYVTVNPYPTVALTASNNTICLGDSVYLNGNPSGGTGNYQHYWTGAPVGELLLPIISNPVFIPSSTGNYNLVYEVTDTIGCNTKDSVQIVVNPTPTANISVNNNPICVGDTVNLDASGAGITNYTWTTGATTSTINETPNSSTAYGVVVSNGFNCSDSTGVNITVNPLPNVQITGDSAICSGQNANLNASGANNYSWSTGGSGNSITITPTADSIITVLGTDGNGCSKMDSILVQVTNQPNGNISASDTIICSGDSVVLNVTGGNSYTWLGPATLNGNTSSIVTDYPSSNPTQYAVEVAIGTCLDTAYQNVTVNPLPNPTINANNPICLGDTAFLSASGGVGYVWNTGATSANIFDLPNTSTTYNVTVTDANNCSNTAAVTITVNPLPNVQIAGTDSICDGSSTTLTANGANSYVWNTSQTTNQIIVNPTSNTTYVVTGTDGNNCSNTDSITIFILPKPVATVTGDTLICYNSGYTLTASGGTTYLWDDGSSTPTFTGTAVDTSLHYVIVGLGQCFDTAYVTTYSKPLPVINAYYDTTIYLGQSVQIFSQASNAVTWTPTNDLSCSNCNNPIASPKETTRYCASTTENGCIDTSCVTVIVDLTCGDIFMPSAFSPNGDGENDCYQPLGNCIDEVLFRIYSRWGEVIFETTDKNACWDGSFKGKDLNTGVYTYTVSAKLYNGEEVELKGNVSLFR